MSDYISREAAIEKIMKLAGCAERGGNGCDTCGRAFCDVRTIIYKINRLPAANVTLMQGWVPISEGNPKEKGCYLVSVKHWVDGKPVTREAYWNGADWLSCDKRNEITPRVIHWMPLPEPPKEDNDGN